MSERIDETDWKAVAVQLAAIDHRAADIILAADNLYAALVEYFRASNPKNMPRRMSPDETRMYHERNADNIKAAMDAWLVVRNGQ